MEPYPELGDAEMKPHAEPERLDKLGRKRGGGIEQSAQLRHRVSVVRIAVEGVYRRAAEGKEYLVAEIKWRIGCAGGRRTAAREGSRRDEKRGDQRATEESSGGQRRTEDEIQTQTHITKQTHTRTHAIDQNLASLSPMVSVV